MLDPSKPFPKIRTSEPVLHWVTEDKLFKEMEIDAKKACKPYYAAFAECSKNKLFSVVWKCSEQRIAIIDCISRNFNDEEMDKRRQQWIEEFERQHPDFSGDLAHVEDSKVKQSSLDDA
jgi:COX assembly protein 1